MFTDFRGTCPLVLKVFAWAGDLHKEITNTALFAGQNLYEPIAERLYRELREPLKGYLPLNSRYNVAFHEFEVLLALTYIDIQKEREPDEDWVPLGRFAVLERTRHGSDSEYGKLRAEYEQQGSEWGPIRYGLLKQKTSSDETVPTVETVSYNLAVIDAMMQRIGRRL